VSVSGEIVYSDGSKESIDARSLIGAAEGALSILWVAIWRSRSGSCSRAGSDRRAGAAMKIRSCMTLFHRAAPEETIFGHVLDRYFGGVSDQATDARLETDHTA
jgi:hypothetical protein